MTNTVVFDFVLVFDAHLLLVETTGKDICSFLSLFRYERFLSESNSGSYITLISDRVRSALVEFVVIAQLFDILHVHRWLPVFIEILVCNGLILNFGLFWFRHLSQMVLALLVKSFCLARPRFYSLNTVDKVLISTASCTIIVRNSIEVLIMSEPYRRIQQISLEISLFCILKNILVLLVGLELINGLSLLGIRRVFWELHLD